MGRTIRIAMRIALIGVVVAMAIGYSGASSARELPKFMGWMQVEGRGETLTVSLLGSYPDTRTCRDRGAVLAAKFVRELTGQLLDAPAPFYYVATCWPIMRDELIELRSDLGLQWSRYPPPR